MVKFDPFFKFENCKNTLYTFSNTFPNVIHLFIYANEHVAFIIFYKIISWPFKLVIVDVIFSPLRLIKH